MSNATTQKKISFNFKDFLDNWALCDEQSCKIRKPEHAELIMLIDHDEQFTHVELPSSETAESKHAILWNIKDWHTRYENWLADRKANNKERMKLMILSENIQRVKYALSRATGIAPEFFEKTARTISASGNVELAKQFGVNNLELLTEEQLEHKLRKQGYEV